MSAFWSLDFCLSSLTVPEVTGSDGASASCSSGRVSVWVSGWWLVFPNNLVSSLLLCRGCSDELFESKTCSYSEMHVELAHTVMGRVYCYYFIYISLKSINWLRFLSKTLDTFCLIDGWLTDRISPYSQWGGLWNLNLTEAPAWACWSMLCLKFLHQAGFSSLNPSHVPLGCLYTHRVGEGACSPTL